MVHSQRCLVQFFFFFFFQAEDGIRDWSVTGVQTCALPISERRTNQGGGHRVTPPAHGVHLLDSFDVLPDGQHRIGGEIRSGEGRVGEERENLGGGGALKKKKVV